MKLLLDEHHAPRSAARLRDLGHDVRAVAKSPELVGLPDDELLRAATADGRAVVTEDSGDFRRVAALWAQSGEDHVGIVLTPPARFRRRLREYPENLVPALVAFLDDPPDDARNEIWWLPGG